MSVLSLSNLNDLPNLRSGNLLNSVSCFQSLSILRMAFAVDPTKIPALRNTQFFIERRLQAPYSENRWFSGAPIQTEEHLRHAWPAAPGASAPQPRTRWSFLETHRRIRWSRWSREFLRIGATTSLGEHRCRACAAVVIRPADHVDATVDRR